MTRNPDQKKREEVHYSRKNPPASEEEARACLDVLSADIVRIGTDLEHKEVESFPSDAAYETWRARAISALGSKRVEIRFLRDWLQESDLAKRPDLNKISQEIRDRANSKAEELRAGYVRVYGADKLPATPDEAHARLALLTEARGTVQACLTEIAAAWVKHPLRRADLVGVKAPLVEILTSVEAEARVVKRFISKEVAEALPKKRYWKSVCVTALTRAAISGFVLTPEEQEVLNELVADMAARASAAG